MRLEHNGTGCPVPLDSMVRVWCRCGESFDEIARHITWDWAHIEREGQVVAYEVLSKEGVSQ